jgi:hypothetical protein
MGIEGQAFSGQEGEETQHYINRDENGHFELFS